jgi:hypothetical protein
VFVLGLHVGTEGSRWSIRGVLLDPSTDAVSSTVIEHFPDKRHDEATQAREAHDAIASALRGHEVSASVLREADYHPRAKITDGAKRRLRLEGACLAACRATGMQVEVKNGKEIGATYGGKKGDAFDAARDLGVDEKLVDATAAALSAKSLI